MAILLCRCLAGGCVIVAVFRVMAKLNTNNKTKQELVWIVSQQSKKVIYCRFQPVDNSVNLAGVQKKRYMYVHKNKGHGSMKA